MGCPLRAALTVLWRTGLGDADEMQVWAQIYIRNLLKIRCCNFNSLKLRIQTTSLFLYLGMKSLYRACVLTIFLAAASLANAQSISIGGEFGMGVQSIQETEAVLSNGWQVAFMPQLALRLRYRKGEVFGFRFGAQLLQKGGRIPATSTLYPDAPAATGFVIVQGTYAVANAGISAGTDLGSGFRVEGFIDLAAGVFMKGTNRNTLYPRGHPARVTTVSNLFNTTYFGIHLGGSLGWEVAPQCLIYLQPTLEAQLNNAFRSSVFVPRFIGFVPLLGFSYQFQ